MVPYRWCVLASLVALCLLLAALGSLGLALLPAMVGMTCGAGLCAVVGRGLASAGSGVIGPADMVTMARAILACGLVALVVDPAPAQPAAAAVVPIAVVALALDAVDGRVARVTGTTSAFGSRFDGEADAFLLLVLSVHVSLSHGWWVLAIGVARYAFGVAGWALPWLRVRLPFRYWRKVVTAAQGIALVVAAAGILPRPATYAALVAALALLAESFGRDVLWSWQRHSALLAQSVRIDGLRVP